MRFQLKENEKFSGVPKILLGAFCVYLLLGFLGINQSSLNVNSMSGARSTVQEYSGGGKSIGFPRDIRSDEFLRSTPMLLGFLRSGDSDFTSPLVVDPFFGFNLPKVISDILIFPEISLIQHSGLPISSQFALIWWLPFLLLFTSLILIGKLLNSPTKFTVSIFVFFCFAPASVWWSFAPIQILCNLLFAFYFINFASTNNLIAKASPLAGGYFAIRAASYYQPWAIVLGSVVIVTAVAYLFKSKSKNIFIHNSSLFAIGLIVFGIMRFYPHRESLQVLLKTIYPGERIVSQGQQSFEYLFSTPYLWNLQFPGLNLVNTNQSEITSFFVIPGLVLLCLNIFTYFRTKELTDKQFAGLIGGFVTLFWVGWAILNMEIVQSYLPLINRVPGFRATQVVGACFIFLILFLYPINTNVSKNTRIFLAALFSLITLYSGLKIKNSFLPDMKLAELVLIPALIGLLLFHFLNREILARYKFLAMSLIVFVGLFVNPINIGLGEYDGKISTVLIELEKRDPRSWASDSLYTDALLMASGIKSVSGQQTMGPDVRKWMLLDPNQKFATQWNRGTSYIWIKWTQNKEIVITNPGTDVIQIEVNPCSSEMQLLGLGFFIKNKDSATFECATPVSEFKFMGSIKTIFQINAR